ncbi:uncharacterized protein [Hemitrygon akajei]|uniref:uncharacterized protein n=1 Tax=Hemitrygon akajei TaxID=2704970 RepID=UPI003BFA2FBA
MITAALLLLIAVVKDQSENVQAQEEKPVLTADRGDGVYMLGEGISFTCKTTKCRYSKKTVVLYKNGKEVLIEPTYYSERDIATFTIKATSTGSEYYSCAYSCRKVESDKSSTVLIKVVAPPEKPSLVPDRTYKFYLSDERITFTCTAKDLHPFSNYLLYKVGLQTPVKRRNYSWQRSATFNVTNTRAGIYDYYCVYTFSMLERNVTSEKSETVKITVVGEFNICRFKVFTL